MPDPTTPEALLAKIRQQEAQVFGPRPFVLPDVVAAAPPAVRDAWAYCERPLVEGFPADFNPRAVFGALTDDTLSQVAALSAGWIARRVVALERHRRAGRIREWAVQIDDFSSLTLVLHLHPAASSIVLDFGDGPIRVDSVPTPPAEPTS